MEEKRAIKEPRREERRLQTQASSVVQPADGMTSPKMQSWPNSARPPGFGASVLYVSFCEKTSGVT